MLHIIIKVVMVGILAIMFLGIILPAFFTKPGNTTNHQYVLAIDSASSAQQQTMLNYLELLMKRDILTKPRVVVVILGKGLSILQTNSGRNLPRINQLQNSGVDFYICSRSLRRFTEQHPHIKELVSGLAQVENGPAYVNRLMDEGYINDFA